MHCVKIPKSHKHFFFQGPFTTQTERKNELLKSKQPNQNNDMRVKMQVNSAKVIWTLLLSSFSKQTTYCMNDQDLKKIIYEEKKSDRKYSNFSFLGGHKE